MTIQFTKFPNTIYVNNLVIFHKYNIMTDYFIQFPNTVLPNILLKKKKGREEKGETRSKKIFLTCSQVFY